MTLEIKKQDTKNNGNNKDYLLNLKDKSNGKQYQTPG